MDIFRQLFIVAGFTDIHGKNCEIQRAISHREVYLTKDNGAYRWCFKTETKRLSYRGFSLPLAILNIKHKDFTNVKLNFKHSDYLKSYLKTALWENTSFIPYFFYRKTYN